MLLILNGVSRKRCTLRPETKWWKMLFISPQNPFSFSRYFSSCLDFSMYWNGLIKKIRLIWNSMTSQPGLQTIVIHMLANISRSKGNQIMKFGQLIECNMRNIFIEKWYAKWPLPQTLFWKIKIEHISGSVV